MNLVLGSSHAFYGIDSKLLDGCNYNLASVGQSLMEDYEIIKYLKSNDFPIKEIILPFSYFSNWHLLYKTPIDGEQMRIFDYRFIYNIDYPASPNVKNWLKYLSGVCKSLTSQTNVKKFDKWGNLTGNCDSAKIVVPDAKAAFDNHNLNCNFSETNPYIDSINSFCLKNNVKLFIVIMPFTKSYRNLVNATKFNYFIDNLKNRYCGNNCFLFDDRELFESSEESIMFRDADHLSLCGRQAFTSFLNNQINATVSKTNNTHQGSN